MHVGVQLRGLKKSVKCCGAKHPVIPRQTSSVYVDQVPNLTVLTHLTRQVRLMVVQPWEWMKMTERLTPVVSTSKVYTVISSFRQRVWSSKAPFKKHFSSQQRCRLMTAGDSKAAFQLQTARKNVFKKQSDIQESFANVSFGVIQACYIKVIFVIMAVRILFPQKHRSTSPPSSSMMSNSSNVQPVASMQPFTLCKPSPLLILFFNQERRFQPSQ